ncbi:MAG: methyl-accepting chemotaxis protein [Idiomarina sp.]|nr:methyl-accepting chemotaxis protein [Idiomarina sp.]
MSRYNFRAQAFRIGNAINVLLFLVALLLASWHQTWGAALLIGIPALLVPFALLKLLDDHQISRAAYGVSFMLFSALHIHQGMGMTEIHFGIFVLLAILIAFRDYLVIVVAAAVIAVHHLLFMYLQSNGASVYLVPQSDATLTIVAIHAAYVVIEAAVLVVICRSSFKEAKVGQAFYDVTKAMVADNGQIVLDKRCPPTGSRVTEQFNTALDRIQQAMQSIESATGKTREYANHLLSDGEQLSQAMRNKLKEVERIATATEQMSASIEQTAEMAQQANDASAEASQSVIRGKQAVSLTQQSVTLLTSELSEARENVATMASSVEDIKSVLQVIDKVAEQTNLLALNAAIEAARAGDHGRGFAVVADEVRKLASQTRGSTEQIQSNIGRLVTSSDASVATVSRCLSHAESSLDAVTDSDEMLSTIEQHAQQVRDAVHTIASALEEQSNASNEIAQSAQALNQIEQEQSVQSDKVVSRARSLESVSDDLDRQSERFVL